MFSHVIRVLADLISEANDTKTAIDEAHTSIKYAIEADHDHAHKVAERHHEQAVRQSDIFESNLFGFDGGVPASAPPAKNDYNAPPSMNMLGPSQTSKTTSRDNFSVEDDDDDDDGIEDVGPHQGSVNQKYPSQQTLPAVAMGSTVDHSASGERKNGPNPFDDHKDESQQQKQIFSQDMNQLEPPQVQRQAYSHGGHHYRNSSLGFAADFVMGGAAAPMSQSGGFSPPAATTSEKGNYGCDDEEALSNVAELKKKASAAQETARDAEAAYKKLAAEADELRTDADKAEATVRSLRAAASELKKGAFGGGKKKKIMVSSWNRLVCGENCNRY